MNKPQEGNHPEKQTINERVSLECPNCASTKTIWQERILLEGSLENYHLMHTEVDDVYVCENCKHVWKVFRFL